MKIIKTIETGEVYAVEAVDDSEEGTGKIYQSVFPTHQAELSALHPNEQEATAYLLAVIHNGLDHAR